MTNEFQNRKGGISVQTEHIFPIIKKWLYSEKEIFLRELVSNACDATTKLKRLASLGEYDANGETYRIDVAFSSTEKTITIKDNGIGMTEEELDRYICQMALSGAFEFVQKYEGKADENNGIIGHFGLGFYSAFMVADRVDIITKSYTSAPAVFWTCKEDGNYEVSPSDKEEKGTEIVLHINDEGEEFLTSYKLKELLDKYCAFMPVEIYLVDEDAEQKEELSPINDTKPLWQKPASECTEEEYNKFYQKVFGDYREPLFSLHLNADYPLNFKGILYFPKLRENYENLEGKIKLYYNQVFVADNIKEVIPEYLLMLRGVLDCPELPLNVSRNYLQNSAYVSKVANYIVKKVADKLNALCNLEKEKFEKLYPDLKTFVEYACICDKKFYDRVSPSLLFRLSGGKMTNLSDYLENAKETNENTVYYATDEKGQASYISMYEAKGIDVVILDTVLDTRFVQSVEQYMSDQKVKFISVDADLSAFKEEGEAKMETAISIFEKIVGKSEQIKIETVALSDESVPAVFTVAEESRRMQEMMRMYAPDSPEMPLSYTLTLNTNCDLIVRINDGAFGDKNDVVAKQIYRLAQISHRKLEAAEMKEFLSDSYNLLRGL